MNINVLSADICPALSNGKWKLTLRRLLMIVFSPSINTQRFDATTNKAK